jgi:hypothetical protein
MAKRKNPVHSFNAVHEFWVSFLSLLFHTTIDFSRARIAAAIQEYQDKTCIRFVPKTDSDFDYVHIVPEEGCYSMVGKTGKFL